MQTSPPDQFDLEFFSFLTNVQSHRFLVISDAPGVVWTTVFAHSDVVCNPSVYDTVAQYGGVQHPQGVENDNAVHIRKCRRVTV